jgi:hypothetical protein
VISISLLIFFPSDSLRVKGTCFSLGNFHATGIHCFEPAQAFSNINLPRIKLSPDRWDFSQYENPEHQIPCNPCLNLAHTLPFHSKKTDNNKKGALMTLPLIKWIA